MMIRLKSQDFRVLASIDRTGVGTETNSVKVVGEGAIAGRYLDLRHAKLV